MKRISNFFVGLVLSTFSIAIFGFAAHAQSRAALIVDLSRAKLPLQFFRAKGAGGGVILRVTDEGLFVAEKAGATAAKPAEKSADKPTDKKLCAWNAPKFSAPDARKMELINCPSSSPVRSFPGELRISAQKVGGTTVPVEYNGETLYINLARLPAGSWSFEDSGKDAGDLDQRKLLRLAQDSSLGAFQKEVIACLDGQKPAACLPKYLVDKLYFPAASPKNTDSSQVTSARFAEFLVSSRSETCERDACRYFDNFRACFDAKAQVAFKSIRLVGPHAFCELQKDAEGWRVALFGDVAAGNP